MSLAKVVKSATSGVEVSFKDKTSSTNSFSFSTVSLTSPAATVLISIPKHNIIKIIRATFLNMTITTFV